MGLLLGTPSLTDGVSVKKSWSYTFSSGKPAGMVEDASRTEMLPLVIGGGTRLGEANATSATFSPLNWYGEAPDLMGTRRYRATMIVGNGSAGTNRGALVWVGGNDGAGGDGITNVVWFRIRGQGGLAAVIGTKQGLSTAHTTTDRVSGANTLVAASDTIGLEISESGGIYTYTGLKNGNAVSGAVWTDSGGVFGVPGKAWGCGGYSLYSGGYFGSLGAFGMSALDL